MAFELFTGKRIHYNQRVTFPSVTVYANGVICFSKDCSSALGDAVELMLERESRRARFVSSTVGAKHAFNISYTKNPRGKQGKINAKRFLELLGNPEQGRYKASIDEGVVEVDFKNEPL